MAQLGNLGDFSNDKERSFEPVPAGKYKAQIVESELCDTREGGGKYVKAQFEILEGSHAGRRIFTNYNVFNRNAQAQEIGRGQLKSMAVASGHPNPDTIRDTDELHGRPVMITVTVRPAKGEFGESNDIKGYTAISGATVKPSAAAAPSQPSLKAAAGF